MEAAEKSQRQPHVLEKDIWVVQTMAALFGASSGSDLVLRGGTSLSKAFGILQRFSEDIDVAYDIRALVPDLIETADNTGYDPIPPTRSQMAKWSRIIRSRLNDWMDAEALPVVKERMAEAGFRVLRIERQHQEIYIHYRPLFEGHAFIKPQVKIDFSGRTSGVPNSEQPIICDAAKSLPDIAMPATRVAAMAPERTFWEKAMGAHTCCLQERVRSTRYSRHWHDLICLDQSGYGFQALADPSIAEGVVHHRSVFFRARDAHDEFVDFAKAASGQIRLVPSSALRDELEKDYRLMANSGMLLGEEKSFDQLMEETAALEEKINTATAVTMAGDPVPREQLPRHRG